MYLKPVQHLPTHKKHFRRKHASFSLSPQALFSLRFQFTLFLPLSQRAGKEPLSLSQSPLLFSINGFFCHVSNNRMREYKSLWLYVISILNISPSLSSSPQKECAAWLTTVKGFRFAPMNDPYHPPPHQSPLTVIRHAQRGLCGELLKKNGRVCPFLARLFL